MKKEKEELQDAQSALEEVLDQFGDGVEICGRVYRITTPTDSVGKPSREAVGKVDDIVDEDYIGRTFGSGSYLVKYSIKDSKQTVYKAVTMHIGREYDKFRQQPQAVQAEPAPTVHGLDLGGILGGLTVEKITVIGGLVKAVKDFLAPPPPAVDMTELLKVMIANNSHQSVSDAVIIKAMDGMQKQNTPPSIAQQVAEFKALKEAFTEDVVDSEEKGDTMNWILEKAFDVLPNLLQKKNNDYQAVGREVRDNPLVKSIINSDPDLTKKFFERAVENYGIDAANQLAAGFGYQVQQQPQQITESVENGENLG
jgi:hypothetical protein